MTKDGIHDKISRDLHRAYDHVLEEPVPEELDRLLAELPEEPGERD
jgi:hypothetical protein